jgi:hypothetical protein
MFLFVFVARQYLQSRELEYIMGCNNLYEYTYFFYIGSFKRFWAWTRVSSKETCLQRPERVYDQ